MTLLKEQKCPWCGFVQDEHCWHWEEGTHYVECDDCKKKYEVNTMYKFLGFDIYKSTEE